MTTRDATYEQAIKDLDTAHRENERLRAVIQGVANCQKPERCVVCVAIAKSALEVAQ